MNPSLRGAPVALQGARAEKGWCRANAINFLPEVIVLKRANTPSLAGYRCLSQQFNSVIVVPKLLWTTGKTGVDGVTRYICGRPSECHSISCANQSFLLVCWKLFKNMKTQAGEMTPWVKCCSPGKHKDVMGSLASV